MSLASSNVSSVLCAYDAFGGKARRTARSKAWLRPRGSHAKAGNRWTRVWRGGKTHTTNRTTFCGLWRTNDNGSPPCLPCRVKWHSSASVQQAQLFGDGPARRTRSARALATKAGLVIVVPPSSSMPLSLSPPPLFPLCSQRAGVLHFRAREAHGSVGAQRAPCTGSADPETGLYKRVAGGDLCQDFCAAGPHDAAALRAGKDARREGGGKQRVRRLEKARGGEPHVPVVAPCPARVHPPTPPLLSRRCQSPGATLYTSTTSGGSLHSGPTTSIEVRQQLFK